MPRKDRSVKRRGRHGFIESLPMWLTAVLGAYGSALSWFGTEGLLRTGSAFGIALNRMPILDWDRFAWAGSGLVGLMALMAWVGGSVALRCSEILRQRLLR